MARLGVTRETWDLAVVRAPAEGGAAPAQPSGDGGSATSPPNPVAFELLVPLLLILIVAPSVYGLVFIVIRAMNHSSIIFEAENNSVIFLNALAKNQNIVVDIL